MFFTEVFFTEVFFTKVLFTKVLFAKVLFAKVHGSTVRFTPPRVFGERCQRTPGDHRHPLTVTGGAGAATLS
ncbi:hypothetical protein QIS99_15945 [Streptomyces sp. B-S-A8]|uniref:Secreted protein n=1 Tax=Streptomyces solicavernae TaxID=3043614 RepID=A0ABT6RTC4_9ACTN|nr:hypothetical protein [Streptomyces sp. B-S-A8]MDI3387680.1 hypothetical protein [Streptomyces sp. B-S-A8]